MIPLFPEIRDAPVVAFRITASACGVVRAWLKLAKRKGSLTVHRYSSRTTGRSTLVGRTRACTHTVLWPLPST